MAGTNATVTFGFNLPVTSSTAVVLDDPVRGLLGSSTYLLAAAVTDATTYVRGVSIRRGRDSLLWEDINAGTCSIELLNTDRRFDPTHTTGPYYGQIVPGVAVIVAVEGVPIFTGRVQDWDFDYTTDGYSIATAKCVDGLGTLGSEEFDDWTSTVGQLTGARIAAILDRIEVSWNSVSAFARHRPDHSAGRHRSRGARTSSTTRSSSPRSELGYFFADRYNVLTFLDRYYRVQLGGDRCGVLRHVRDRVPLGSPPSTAPSSCITGSVSTLPGW
jgi:hypothetical protein